MAHASRSATRVNVKDVDMTPPCPPVSIHKVTRHSMMVLARLLSIARHRHEGGQLLDSLKALAVARRHLDFVVKAADLQTLYHGRGRDNGIVPHFRSKGPSSGDKTTTAAPSPPAPSPPAAAPAPVPPAPVPPAVVGPAVTSPPPPPTPTPATTPATAPATSPDATPSSNQKDEAAASPASAPAQFGPDGVPSTYTLQGSMKDAPVGASPPRDGGELSYNAELTPANKARLEEVVRCGGGFRIGLCPPRTRAVFEAPAPALDDGGLKEELCNSGAFPRPDRCVREPIRDTTTVKTLLRLLNRANEVRPAHTEPASAPRTKWTPEEHDVYIAGARKYNKDFSRIAKDLPFKTARQVRAHHYNYQKKLKRGGDGGGGAGVGAGAGAEPTPTTVPGSEPVPEPVPPIVPAPQK